MSIQNYWVRLSPLCKYPASCISTYNVQLIRIHSVVYEKLQLQDKYRQMYNVIPVYPQSVYKGRTGKSWYDNQQCNHEVKRGHNS